MRARLNRLLIAATLLLVVLVHSAPQASAQIPRDGRDGLPPNLTTVLRPAPSLHPITLESVALVSAVILLLTAVAVIATLPAPRPNFRTSRREQTASAEQISAE